MAEAVRFELTVASLPSTVFKTVALNHSATLPWRGFSHAGSNHHIRGGHG